MRLLYPLLLTVILAIVVITMMSSDSTGSPKDTADKFLESVQKGDYKSTVEMFGGNTCRCPKKGGWVSYLVYASAQEPNLAFMMGRPFSFGNLRETAIKHPDQKHVTILPWQHPEDVIVDLDISFDEGRYMPMFLPLKMAYGMPISETDFKEFAKNPDPECWKGFALRLRPSIAAGAIERPEASKGIEYKPTEKVQDVNAAESLSLQDKQKMLVVESKGKAIPLSSIKVQKNVAPEAKDEEEESDDSFIYANIEEAIKETLGDEVAMYLHPKDAGPVKLADGTDMTAIDVEKQLPRLQSAKLRLHIVRREQLRRWTVYHMGILEPVLKLQDGSAFPLKSYRSPSGEAVPDPGESAPDTHNPSDDGH